MEKDIVFDFIGGMINKTLVGDWGGLALS